MDSKEKYKVIGLMSGTSLDGVDIACCIIKRSEGNWVYAIEAAQTVRYSLPWVKKLSTVHKLKGEELIALHVEYGKYLALLVNAFTIKNKLKNINFISSHGHTVFHQPEQNFTFQLGSGNALHAASRLPVVWDFRSLDVALGGQGAPLVPVGDKFLFHNYDACLNLGGISNISFDSLGKRVAFDVCFVNMAMNYVASKAGKSYDENGQMASDGQVNETLLQALDKVYAKIRKNRPSLGREFFEKTISPLLDRESISINDRLRTLAESASLEIAKSISGFRKKKLSVLCTGGGAFNSFLMYRLVESCGDDISIIVPDEDIIKFKEALVFAFLGVLRIRKEINCLRSVTGARADSSSGITIGFKD
jgi:anhydro-N-acetylmuramic acid kinase